jgi:hypothetical protein
MVGLFIVAALTASGTLLFSNPGGLGELSAYAVGGNGVYTSAVTHLITTESATDHTTLAPATAPPQPVAATVAAEPPLPSHQVFGFAPYWTLGQSGGFDVSGLTTLAYFGVDVNADGSLDESGPGWNGFQSQDWADLETRAHAAGDRVLLTITCFDQGVLDKLTSSATAPSTLSAALISALESMNLDGVNIDFEGTGNADQEGLTNLVTQVSGALHSTNPNWQVTMDTYASSASSDGGFYNIAALAPEVDGFFVMAYSLNLDANPTSSSPLTSTMFSDLTAIRQYLAVVPASKVILGLPYFGYSWPTAGAALGAEAVGGATAVTASQVMSGGTPIYWDAATDTAWTSFQVGSQWYQSYFENPTSLYMAAQLASSYGLAGDGVWALGMDGNNPEMLAAVDGSAPPVKDLPSGPSLPSASGTSQTPTGTDTITTAPLPPDDSTPPTGTTTTTASSATTSTAEPSTTTTSTAEPSTTTTSTSEPSTTTTSTAEPSTTTTSTGDLSNTP